LYTFLVILANKVLIIITSITIITITIIITKFLKLVIISLPNPNSACAPTATRFQFLIHPPVHLTLSSPILSFHRTVRFFTNLTAHPSVQLSVHPSAYSSIQFRSHF
jgi:hypothetical protein